MNTITINSQISTSAAHALAFLFASCYVGSLYVSKNGRPSPLKKYLPPQKHNESVTEGNGSDRWRDDPKVIQSRLLAATICTFFCCGIVFAILNRAGNKANKNIVITFRDTMTRLGFIPTFGLHELLPHFITPLLFLGPIYGSYLGAFLPFQEHWSFQRGFINQFFCWQGVRNYIVAPITEEVVFRACVLTIYHLSGASIQRLIIIAPLPFGLAHIHHAWETYNRHGRTASAAKIAVTRSAFQFSYTTIFGFYCSYLFLRTGSIYPPISAHVFCNFMGFPELVWELQNYPHRKIIILFVYLSGIVLFQRTLGPFTKSNTSLYWHH